MQRCSSIKKLYTSVVHEHSLKETNNVKYYSNGDAVDVVHPVPPIGMSEPGPRGPLVSSELRTAIPQHDPCPANMLMLGQRWPNVCSYVGSTSHANVGSTLFCSLGLRWPYRWRQPFANLQPMLIQRWPNVIQYEITLGQR